MSKPVIVLSRDQEDPRFAVVARIGKLQREGERFYEVDGVLYSARIDRFIFVNPELTEEQLTVGERVQIAP